jgi:hypothetical protein
VDGQSDDLVHVCVQKPTVAPPALMHVVSLLAQSATP